MAVYSLELEAVAQVVVASVEAKAMELVSEEVAVAATVEA